MVKVINHSTFKIDLKKINNFASRLIDDALNLEIIFIKEGYSKELNNKYCKINSSTYVLTFTEKDKEYTHQIFICPKIAQRNAKKYQNSLEKELIILIFHGYKHISGFDHT